MGRHGGLNILPQKKWNVYNYENRVVVERDQQLVQQERERRERLQRAQQLQDQIKLVKHGGDSISAPIDSQSQEETKRDLSNKYAEENELYSKAIKKQKRKEQLVKDKILSTTFKPIVDDKHINLFVNEELNERLKHTENSTEHPTKGQPVLKDLLSRYTNPWYAKMRKTDYVPEPGVKVKKMEEPAPVKDKTHHKKHHHKSHHRHKQPAVVNKTTEELRKEREEREQKERERIAKLLAQKQ